MERDVGSDAQIAECCGSVWRNRDVEGEDGLGDDVRAGSARASPSSTVTILNLAIACPVLDGGPAQFLWQELLLKSSAGFLQKLSIKELFGRA